MLEKLEYSHTLTCTHLHLNLLTVSSSCGFLALKRPLSSQLKTAHILDTARRLGQSNYYQRQPLQLTAGVSSDILQS